MSNVAQKQELQTVNDTQAVTPMTMLSMAIEKGTSMEQLEKLMDMQIRWEAHEAKKAFATAMTNFRADPPVIYKSKNVSFETTKGTTTYNHALLEDAAETIGAALTKHGLSFRWETEQLEGGIVKVTCIIMHVLGHSERTTLQAGLDQSGGKNNIQALGSSVSYLQRYTLFAATGTAAKGEDNDGHGATSIEYITESQAADIVALIEEVKADKGQFLAFFKIDSIETMPAKVFKQAVAMLVAKRKKVQK